jgi:hypothetical protein
MKNIINLSCGVVLLLDDNRPRCPEFDDPLSLDHHVFLRYFPSHDQSGLAIEKADTGIEIDIEAW